jgi:hypothetical protein
LKSAKSMSLKKIKKNNNAGRKKCRYWHNGRLVLAEFYLK